MSLLWAALLCLYFGACFGALWLVQHIGSGWPPSQHDMKPTERRTIGLLSLLLLIAAVVFVIAKLAQP